MTTVFIISAVPRLNIIPSPSAEVVITPYGEATFPEFRQIFEAVPEDSPLRHFARDPAEAAVSIVLENRSDKAITAWRFRWRRTDQAGKLRSSTASGDSYMTDVFRAVAEPGSRHLVGPSGTLDKRNIEHALGGGTFITITNRERGALAEVVEVSFEIDFVLFADGEIAGPDADRYATELGCRKHAAEFIARQIRLAMVEGRDATPVLTALAEMPCLGRLGHGPVDALSHLVRDFAQEYLRHQKTRLARRDATDTGLRRLETRPELPRFYHK